MHGTHGGLSIWFFIGLLLTAYGLIIAATGLYEMTSPLEHPPVLASLHASIWWGGILFVIGLVYFIRFFPRRRKHG
jgi:FtsH-binding integral membrane protein